MTICERNVAEMHDVASTRRVRRRALNASACTFTPPPVTELRRSEASAAARGLRWAVCLAFFLSSASGAPAKLPPEVLELVSEMEESGGTSGLERSKDIGLFAVGIGRVPYRADAIDSCREQATIEAKKELASALSLSLKARDVAALKYSDDGKGHVEASEDFSSETEVSVDNLIKGLKVVRSGRNAAGKMEVVVYVSEKQKAYAQEFEAAQLTWGDKGVVQAVGVAPDRALAEKNALRSAVEQVAGTLVVGKVSVSVMEKEEFHKHLATTAGALVESYRVTKETRVESEYRIEILARVSKRKLYENYRSYFKCLGDPAFCLVATNKELIEQFNQFFEDKGLRLVTNPGEADYLICLDGRFRDRPTPGNASSEGTMLNLTITVRSADGSRVLLTMKEKQAKDSAVLTADQRREEVCRRIFEKVEKQLHQAVQNMVMRMLDDAE